jgi:hypothetical protein
MLSFSQLLLAILLFANATIRSVANEFVFESSLNAFGNRVVILVAFDANYTTLSTFSSTLHDFVTSYNCPARHQLVSWYFGNLSTRVDCAYKSGLRDCMTKRIFASDSNVTIAVTAMQRYYEVVF